MTDLTQLLGDLSPEVSNVVQQVQAGSHAAVPDSEAHTAFSQTAGQLSPEQFQQVATDAYGKMSPERAGRLPTRPGAAARDQCAEPAVGKRRGRRPKRPR